MYPVSSAISRAAAFVGAPDSEDDGGTKGGTVQGGDLQQVEVTTLPAAVGRVVSNRCGDGKAQNLRPVASKRRKRLGSGNKCVVTGSRSLLLIEGGCGQSSSNFVKLLFYRDQPGSVSATSSSVASSAAAFVGAPDSEDDGGTKGGIVQGGDLRQVEGTTLPATVGKGVSNRGKGKAQNLRPVVSKGRKRLVSVNKYVVDTGSRPLLLLEGGCDQSSSEFVKLLFYRDQPGSMSATSTASTATPPGDAGSSLLVTKTTSTTVNITTTKGFLRTSSKGKAPALKRGTSIDSDVLNSMGVMLSPDSVRVIECLFFKMDEFARRIYKSTVAKQLPSDVSGKLTVTGRAIWCLTYKVMFEGSLVFKCLCKYHYKHRPNFIRALPSIQVLSDSTGHSTEPLAGDRLLDFLSVLDDAISSRVKSIFDPFWSEVSISLEEGGLNAVSCKDLIDILDTVGIPRLALSEIANNAWRERIKVTDKCTTSEINVIPPFVLSAMTAANAERERNKGIKCTTSEINVTGLTHSLPSGSQ